MRYFVFLLLTLLSFTVIGQERKKPNVLFIIADDLTATAVSPYENQASHTPPH